MKTVLVILSLVLTLILGACTSSLPNPNGPNQPPIEAAITSFGANPDPVPQNIATQFSWSVVGVDLTCRLDVDNNGTVDYTVQGCTSASRVAHQYPAVGKYTAKLTIVAAAGETRSEITEVEVGLANQAPIPNLKLAVPSSNTDPLAVRFNWVVSDQDSDITRCQLDAEGDGNWEYDGLCAGLSKQSVRPSDLVSYFFEYTYAQQGQYTAVLQASDAFQANSDSVVVRVPLNKPPVIEELGATVENGRLKVNYRVSDPDGDPVTCVLKVAGVGIFPYEDCLTPIQTYPTMGRETFDLTLEASDPYQQTRKTLNYSYQQPQGCGLVQNTDWSNAGLVASSRSLNIGGSKSITQVAVSPDCRYMAASLEDKTLKLYDYRNLAAPPRLLAAPGTGDPGACHLEFSPNGQYLAEVGCFIGTTYLRLWDLRSATPVLLPSFLNNDDKPSDAAFSPDGSTVAVTVNNSLAPSERRIVLVNLENLSVIREIAVNGHPIAVAYSPNGKILALSYNAAAAPPPCSTEKALLDCSTQPQGTPLLQPRVAFYSGSSSTPVSERDMGTPPSFLVDLEFTPDGRSLVGVLLAIPTNTIFRWAVGNTGPQGDPVFSTDNLGQLAFDISVSPDSRWVAVPSSQGTDPTYVADLATLTMSGSYAGYGPVAVFTPDGRYLLTGVPTDNNDPTLLFFTR